MEKPIEHLFAKYLEDDCTEAEVRLLLEHFKEAKNEAMLKRLIVAELEQTNEPHIAPAHLDEHLEQIFIQVKNRTRVKNRGPVRLPTIRLRMAAAMIFVLASAAAFFYFYSTRRSEDTAPAEMASAIKPGSDQAVLTLSDGRKISLSETPNGEVARQSGFSITKTDDGQLVYNQRSSVVKEDGSLQYNTVAVPVGGQWQVVLPDGSHVWLNAQSTLTYPTAFAGTERKVKLTGEAYFEVAHDGTRPFRVEGLNQTIEVIGTHFNVMAYPDEPVTKTTLLEGSIRLITNDASQLLKPGEQAQVTATSIQLSKDVDLEDVVAWKNGYFKFNEDLETIMNKVARWYNVDIEYQEHLNPPAYTFEGKISRKRDLHEVLKIMEYTGKVHFAVEGRRVIVKK